MENASKALIMAGTVLISLMVISIGVYIVNMFGDYTSKQEKQREMQQIAEFNAQFLKYEGREDITAQDIVSVANLAKANNELYELTKSDANEDTYYIQVIISGTGGYDNFEAHRTLTINSNDYQSKYLEEKNDFLKNNSTRSDNKMQHYTCNSVIVSDITKRISKISFQKNDNVDE